MLKYEMYKSCDKFILDNFLCIKLSKDYYLLQKKFRIDVFLVKTNRIISHIYEYKMDVEPEPVEVELTYNISHSFLKNMFGFDPRSEISFKLQGFQSLMKNYM
jgi:hypothetical protein